MRVRFAFAAATLLVSAPAFAQTESADAPPKKVIREVYAPNEVIDMEGAKIHGERRAPAGIFMIGHGDQKFPTIIEERVHFKRDLVKSVGITVTSQKSETEAK